MSDTITLTATVDTVTINSIKFNRGNCPILRDSASAALPVTLKFGEIWVDHSICTLLEAEVGTNQGMWTLTWPQ